MTAQKPGFAPYIIKTNETVTTETTSGATTRTEEKTFEKYYLTLLELPSIDNKSTEPQRATSPPEAAQRDEQGPGEQDPNSLKNLAQALSGVRNNVFTLVTESEKNEVGDMVGEISGKVKNPYFQAAPTSVHKILAHGAPLRIVDSDNTEHAPETYLASLTYDNSASSELMSSNGREFFVGPMDSHSRDALLLRFKLLGEVAAIKRELAELLRETYTEQTDVQDQALHCVQCRYPKLGKFGQQLLGAAYRFEHSIARLMALHSAQSSGWLIGLMLLALLVVASASWLLPVHWFSWWLPIAPATVAAGVALLLALGVFLVGFNCRTMEDRLEAHRHEELEEKLRGALARLAQFNVSVQVGNVQDGAGVQAVPEGFIRQIDELFKTHEAVHSLESTIKSRLDTVGESLRELRTKQRKSRRMILAAGGAIFTGFFAHEVGMSVLEYQHLSTKTDSHHLLVWLNDQAHTPKPIPVGHDLTARTKTEMAYDERFGHHALDGMGWVLFITLLFTVCVAVLAMRKSEDDETHHGGHGGHH